MLWYGRVWYGIVWYGMVWYGMEGMCSVRECMELQKVCKSGLNCACVVVIDRRDTIIDDKNDM